MTKHYSRKVLHTSLSQILNLYAERHQKNTSTAFLYRSPATTLHKCIRDIDRSVVDMR